MEHKSDEPQQLQLEILKIEFQRGNSNWESSKRRIGRKEWGEEFRKLIAEGNGGNQWAYQKREQRKTNLSHF